MGAMALCLGEAMPSCPSGRYPCCSDAAHLIRSFMRIFQGEEEEGASWGGPTELLTLCDGQGLLGGQLNLKEREDRGCFRHPHLANGRGFGNRCQ